MAKNEKLKIQLLGRDWAMKMKMARGKGKYGAGTLTSTSSDTVATISTKAKTKHPPAGTKRAGYNNSGSEDDEAGRSSLGKSKNAALLKRGIEGFEIDDDVRDEGDGGFKRDKGAMCEKDMRSNPGAKKRASGYLDEVLADRALRKRRKKGRREEGAVGS